MFAGNRGGIEKSLGEFVMQQINLYQDEFQIRYDRRVTGAVVGLGLMFIIFGIITASQMYSTTQLKNAIAETTETFTNLEKSYKTLEKVARPRAIDLGLVANLESAKRSNSEKLRALNYLSGNDSGNMIGFSYLMRGLGRQRDSVNDLWLKTIEFGRGGYDMRLSGSSYQADLLPQFVRALSDEEIYKDREFREINLTRTDESKPVVDFVLNTRPGKNTAKDDSSGPSLALFVARLKQLTEAGENGN